MNGIEGFKSCEDGHSIIYYRDLHAHCPLCAQKRINELALELVNNITNLVKQNCPTGCRTLTAIQKITED